MRGNIFLIVGLLGMLAFLASGVLGYDVLLAEALRLHVMIGLGACLLMLFSQGWLLIYLAGLARAVRGWQRERGGDPALARQAADWNRRSLPWGLAAAVAVLAAFFLGSAALARTAPSWLHHAGFYLALAAQGWALWRERQVLAASDRLIRTADLRRASDAA